MNILNKDTTHTTYNYKLKFHKEEMLGHYHSKWFEKRQLITL